jgi:hypothetical protein
MAKANNKQRRRRRAQPRRTNNQPGLVISECAANYARALNNPFKAFEEDVQQVCVPDQSLVPSEKSSIITRGTGGTGAGQFGYVIAKVGPFGNDTLIAAASDTTNTATSTTPLNDPKWGFGGGGGPSVSVPGNCYWTEATIGDQRQMRIVACALRVRYIGSKLNEGGRVFAYRSSDNLSVYNDTPNQINNHNATKIYPLRGEWTTITWTPVLSADFLYQQSLKAADEFCMSLVLESAVADMPFEWELIHYIESCGSSVVGQTPTHSDAVGFAAAQTAGQIGRYSFMGQGPSLSEIIRQTASAIRGASHLISSQSGDLKTIAGGAIGAYRMLGF